MPITFIRIKIKNVAIKQPDKTISEFKLKANDISLLNKAVWIKDGFIDFNDDGSESASIINRKLENAKKIHAPSVDLSGWIRKNFSEDDHIILKLDIEGSEHEVFEKLCNDGTIGWLDKIYCEIHGIKAGRTFKEVVKMIDQVNSHGKKLISWATIDRYGQDDWKETEYNLYQIKKEFHKWYMRSVSSTALDAHGNQIIDLPFNLEVLNYAVARTIDAEELAAEFVEPSNGKKIQFHLCPHEAAIKWRSVD